MLENQEQPEQAQVKVAAPRRLPTLVWIIPLLAVALSLGLGIKAPDTSLGLLVSDFQNALTTRPWLFWIPGMFILVISLCVNFIGDGLRDAFDPRQQMD